MMYCAEMHSQQSCCCRFISQYSADELAKAILKKWTYIRDNFRMRVTVARGPPAGLQRIRDANKRASRVTAVSLRSEEL